MSAILVSIIIPCYNVENYVAEAIESALNQSHRPIEIIAVDNNSGDNTLNILRDYAQQYPNLITVLEEREQGAPAARNKGMSIAKGEWLQFLDADDLLLEEKIARQVSLIQSKPKAFLVAGTHICRPLNRRDVICYPDEGDTLKAALKSELGCTVSNLFRKSDKAIQPQWDIRLNSAQDTDFILNYILSFGQEIIYDRAINTITRERPFGQISQLNSRFEGRFEFHLAAREKLKTFFPDFYQNNQAFLFDNLYYVVYSAALCDLEYGTRQFKTLMPPDYFPDFRRGNKISWMHSLGFALLGFKNYVRFRKSFLRI